jgi:hypothetical protein
MVPEKPEDTFKVSDRRRRSAEDEPTAAQAAARPEGPRPPTPEPRHPAPGPGPGLADEPERSLVGLFMMLASSAAISMGDAPDPVTGQRHHDLANAADAIDLLMLLQEKTESHRSTEETQVLDELLYDLQLRYVNATKRSGQPPVPPRS